MTVVARRRFDDFFPAESSHHARSGWDAWATASDDSGLDGLLVQVKL